MKEKRLAGAALYHIIIFAIGIIMVYPLIWMVMSSFKETNTIFTTASSLIPEHFVTDNYANGWKGFAKISFSTFFKNSIFISVIATIGTIASSAVVAYGFARFKFRGKGILFSAMLLSMMLPAQVLMSHTSSRSRDFSYTCFPTSSAVFRSNWTKQQRSTAVPTGASLQGS